MKKNSYLQLLFVMVAISSCKKFLDERPDAALVIPTKVADFQALMDQNSVSNFITTPCEPSADNFYLTYADWNGMPEYNRNQYTWAEEIFFDGPSPWNESYVCVNKCNIALELLPGIKTSPGELIAANNVKGMAHFFRGNSFYNMLQAFAKAYDPATSSTDLGIALRLSPDFNIPSIRASVEESYAQVIADLKASVALLPVNPAHKYRPSRPAAYGMLARTFLSMRKYDQSFLYADSALQLYSTLMDYNNSPDIVPTAAFPFKELNAEVIMFSSGGNQTITTNTKAKVDSLLYRSYTDNDLRKTLFFATNNNGSYSFKGGYNGVASIMSGISVDELFLIRAESCARANNVVAAMQDLNTLMIKRWKTGTFQMFTATTATEALNIILIERRKELLFRDLRWTDIKRLNKEGAGITLRRNLNGVMYELAPNSNQFALPLPRTVIELSGMAQNPR